MPNGTYCRECTAAWYKIPVELLRANAPRQPRSLVPPPLPPGAATSSTQEATSAAPSEADSGRQLAKAVPAKASPSSPASGRPKAKAAPAPSPATDDAPAFAPADDDTKEFGYDKMSVFIFAHLLDMIFKMAFSTT